tara:strand:+ start:324 stop:1277 length:954 start_codon:yes stop_codon:yes gene_type:complete
MIYNLKKSDIFQWQELGYVILKNVIDGNLINECKKLMENKYSTIENSCKDFGSNGELEFPSGTILDNLTIHENLIDIVKILLKSNNILLTMSDAWSKAGTENKSILKNTDQRMHMDYGNNTFLHIGDWHKPEAVSAIIYLSDTNITGGGTAIVPRKGENDELYKQPYIYMPGLRNYKFTNDRVHTENYMKQIDKKCWNYRQKLYKREIIPKYEIGDILFYRLDVWHRGTPVNIGKIRNVVNLQWKKKECFWINIWNPGWTRKAYYGFLEKLFVEMTPKQREILGIPAVNHKYWNKKNIKLLKERYPKINIKPYLSNL